MRTVGLHVAATLALAGCSSTTEKASKIADEGSKAFSQPKFTVAEANADIDVGSPELITDENGTAAIVELENRGTKTLRDVPLALDVLDGAGKSIYKNDASGLAASLVSLPVLAPRTKTVWVNDQVLAAGEPEKVTVTPGAAKALTDAPPDVRALPPTLEDDPVDGVAARGEVVNDSPLEQRDLVVYAVARNAGRIVAAGRAVIPRVSPMTRARYAVFFIGDPTGAALEVSAPPTTLEATP